MSIIKAMQQVAAHFAKSGIEKGDTNKAQGFKFRGIDRVLDSFAGPLSAAGVTIRPSYSDLVRQVQKTKNGEGWLVTLQGTFVLVAADGSFCQIGPFYGEAFDSSDKAVTKAQSIAYRNALLLTFCVPLGPEYEPEMQGNELDDSATGWLELIAGAEDQATLTKIAGSLKEDKEVSPAGLKAARAAWAARSKELKNG